MSRTLHRSTFPAVLVELSKLGLHDLSNVQDRVPHTKPVSGRPVWGVKEALPSSQLKTCPARLYGLQSQSFALPLVPGTRFQQLMPTSGSAVTDAVAAVAYPSSNSTTSLQRMPSLLFCRKLSSSNRGRAQLSHSDSDSGDCGTRLSAVLLQSQSMIT